MYPASSYTITSHDGTLSFYYSRPFVPFGIAVGSAGISLLLIEPAILPGLPTRLVLRDENRDKTDIDLFRSLLTMLALSEPVLPKSRSVAMSINA